MQNETCPDCPVGETQSTYELKSKGNILGLVELVAFFAKVQFSIFAQAWLGCGCIIHVHAHSKDSVFRLDVPVLVRSYSQMFVYEIAFLYSIWTFAVHHWEHILPYYVLKALTSCWERVVRLHQDAWPSLPAPEIGKDNSSKLGTVTLRPSLTAGPEWPSAVSLCFFGPFGVVLWLCLPGWIAQQFKLLDVGVSCKTNARACGTLSITVSATNVGHEWSNVLHNSFNHFMQRCVRAARLGGGEVPTKSGKKLCTASALCPSLSCFFVSSKAAGFLGTQKAQEGQAEASSFKWHPSSLIDFVMSQNLSYDMLMIAWYNLNTS